MARSGEPSIKTKLNSRRNNMLLIELFVFVNKIFDLSRRVPQADTGLPRHVSEGYFLYEKMFINLLQTMFMRLTEWLYHLSEMNTGLVAYRDSCA